jgi:thymidylate synthase ThyX
MEQIETIEQSTPTPVATSATTPVVAKYEKSGPNVFTIANIPPEQLAYGFAKYSRSNFSFVDTLDWQKDQAKKSKNFLDTFYYAFGHKSIADCAVVPMAIENVSTIAAIEIEDERLWSGQERSTRYQDFSAGKYYVPPQLREQSTDFYKMSVGRLYKAYSEMHIKLQEIMVASIPPIEGITHDQYFRNISARAFDVVRAILPYANLTSLGQINSARSLEKQISRLKASIFPEVVEVAEQMRQASVEKIPFRATKLAEKDDSYVFGYKNYEAGPLTPTLLKYTDSDKQLMEVRQAVTEVLNELFKGYRPVVDESKPVEFHAAHKSQYTEVVASLLYRYSKLSYGQCLEITENMGCEKSSLIYELAYKFRGPHDEMLPELRTGYACTFDLLLDGKGMQDFYRHRNCVQIRQDITGRHSYMKGQEWFSLGLPAEVVKLPDTQKLIHDFDAIMDYGEENYGRFHIYHNPVYAPYMLPMGMKRRSLFKMDDVQAAYMIETRSGVNGHFSYRKVSEQMHEALSVGRPGIADYTRLTPFEAAEILNR